MYRMRGTSHLRMRTSTALLCDASSRGSNQTNDLNVIGQNTKKVGEATAPTKEYDPHCHVFRSVFLQPRHDISYAAR